MANRSFSPSLGSLDIGVVEVFASLTVGASGAVASWTGVGRGVKSIVKESTAGQYTVTLEDDYTGLLGASVTLVDATDSDPTTVATSARIKSEAVSASTPTIVLQGTALDDGAAANFASGAKLLIALKLKNSSV